VLQEVLEQEMTDALGAEKGERSPGRLGYRCGYYRRGLVTRVGKLELRIPQDRQGHFSTQIFERYQRSEKALVSALAEMYIQGVSTRKVKAITEELCGHAFSASAISAVNKTLDESLERFAKRPLEETYPYLVLDARYEKVRQDGMIRSQAVQIAIGLHQEGRRQILAVELAPHKIRSNCICPVVATTPMGERFLKRAQKLYGIDVGPEWNFETARQFAAATVPLGLLSEPSDVAYAAVYLASDESRLVSGTYLLLDGASRAG